MAWNCKCKVKYNEIQTRSFFQQLESKESKNIKWLFNRIMYPTHHLTDGRVLLQNVKARRQLVTMDVPMGQPKQSA